MPCWSLIILRIVISLSERDNPQSDKDDDDDDIDGDGVGVDDDDDDDDDGPGQHEPWGQKKVAGDKADPQGALWPTNMLIMMMIR